MGAPFQPEQGHVIQIHRQDIHDFLGLLNHMGVAFRAIADNSHSDNSIEAAERIGDAVALLANAITPTSAVPGEDATGGHVGSLTEAVMGMTAALVRIADEIQVAAEHQ